MRQEPTSCFSQGEKKGVLGLFLPLSFPYLAQDPSSNHASHIKDGSSMPTLLLGK